MGYDYAIVYKKRKEDAGLSTKLHFHFLVTPNYYSRLKTRTNDDIQYYHNELEENIKDSSL